MYVGNGENLDTWAAQYANGAALASVTRLPLQAGSLTQLAGTGTVIVPAGSWRLGQIANLWLDDSAPVRLRVVGVFASQIDLSQTVLLPWELRTAHTATPLASRIYLRLAPGAPPATLRAAAATAGGTLIPAAGYFSAAASQQDHLTRVLLLAVLGLALAYSAIAIAIALTMATAGRKRELGMLRLAGATTGQVLRAIAMEACLVTGIAALLAAALTAVTLAGLRAGLSRLSPVTPLVIPWRPVTTLAVACLIIAVLASMIPAAVTLRKRPTDLAGAGE